MVNIQIDDVIAQYYPQFKALLSLMEQKYPEQVISPNTSMASVMFSAGQRDVLRHFREKVREYEENVANKIIQE